MSADANFLPGYRIGHASDFERRTGCTVVLPPAGTIAAVDVRGGAPGTRETGVFAPGNLVSQIDALLFTGGSAFGLAAANGVMAWLRRAGAGFAVGSVRVPIVAAAVLFDFGVGDPGAFPDERMGEAACDSAAGPGGIATGRVGAGTGATAGKLRGAGHAAGGGLGICRLVLSGGGEVAALAVANPFGDVVDAGSGALLAAPSDGRGGRIRSADALWREALPENPRAGANTTLVCVATTVPFEPGSLKRVAIEAHDGIARAVRPAHTVVDGDVAFALAPGGDAPPLALRLQVGAAAAEAVARAIAAAVSP
ncbi:MAG: P1 family peptidase [Thermoanaerobaculia bacterium]